MNGNTTATSEMAALAAEICDMWQEHLATLSSNPAAKADFMRLIEPQRQAFADLFADYTTMMQHRPHAENRASQQSQNGHAAPAASAEAARGPAAAAHASDDGALRLAQLAHRVAALEERIGKLESSQQSRARRGTRKAAAESGDGNS